MLPSDNRPNLGYTPTRKRPVPSWSGPLVECAECGTNLAPVAILHQYGNRRQWFWSLPSHSGFAGLAPGACPGSGNLLSAVRT